MGEEKEAIKHTLLESNSIYICMYTSMYTYIHTHTHTHTHTYIHTYIHAYIHKACMGEEKEAIKYTLLESNALPTHLSDTMDYIYSFDCLPHCGTRIHTLYISKK
jgi:hypothetical protein